MKKRMIAAIASVSTVAAGWFFLGDRPARAVEDTYGRAFFAGRVAPDWCSGFGDSGEALIASTITSWLDLDNRQRAALGRLINATETALQETPSLCPGALARQRTLPLPEQVVYLRTQIADADVLLAAVEGPLASFYDGLSDEQRDKLTRHLHEYTRGRSAHGGRFFGLR